MCKYSDDKKTIFVRMKKEPVGINSETHGFKIKNGWSFQQFDSNCKVLVVAGKAYPLIDTMCKQKTSLPHIRTIRYTYEQAIEFFNAKSYKETLKSFFDMFTNPNLDLKDLPERFGPVFSINFGQYYYGNKSDVEVIENDCLSYYCFEKVLPPPLCYNEIYKFVCNQTRSNRPIPEMSNDIRIEQAGFDLKTSFRKAKK